MTTIRQILYGGCHPNSAEHNQPSHYNRPPGWLVGRERPPIKRLFVNELKRLARIRQRAGYEHQTLPERSS